MKIVADDKIPYLKGVLEPYAEVVYLPGGKISRADLIDADALLIRTRTRCDHHLLEGTAVRFIASATIGFDHIDTEYCDSNGIVWTNAPGCNSGSVAQYITSLLLNYAGRNGRSLKGSTIGIIGVGNVGSKVARNAEILGMRVLLNDPPRAEKEENNSFVPLETICREADFITCHVPLDHEGRFRTYHLADSSFFNSLARTPFFINSSRGEVADNSALKQALQQKQLCGAALDVWENEPDIDLELLDLLDYGTPHIAGYSADGKATGTAMSVLALLRYFHLEKKFDRSSLREPSLPENRDLDLTLPEYHFLPDPELIRRAVCLSYDITADDSRLRAAPSDFEKQRGDYPFRREFSAWRIKAPERVAAILARLGFTVV